MMNRTELNEDMMVQVNGGTSKEEEETKDILNRKAIMDDIDFPYDLTTPDGKNYHSDGQHHSVSIEVE